MALARPEVPPGTPRAGGPSTVTVLDARGEHDDRDEQAQGSVTMNRFLPLIFLPAS